MAVAFVLLLLFVLNEADSSRIIGGKEAAPHSRPYMASLQIRGGHKCGGALVREDFVLTAAHCRTPTPYTAVLGAHAVSGNEPTKQQFSVIKTIPHPSYDGHRYDIMLLKLNSSAKLTDAVQLIPLKKDRVRACSECITAGWGYISDVGTLATSLREVNVTTVSQRMCRSRWIKVPITQNMICGVGDAVFQGFCSGDSGGPLVCDGAAAAVVSFSGKRCGDPRSPDVYTRVSSFMDWITEVLKSN